MKNLIIAFFLFIVTSRTILADNSLRGKNNDNTPRVVTFGSSRTWGAAMEDREHKSYPGLLNATNLAIRGSGPEYPAMCLYSMMGDDAVYDVVVIEFMLDWVTDALVDLGERVRFRFPKAVIIFLNFWAPRQYIYKPKNQGFQAFHMERATRHDVFQPDILNGTSADDWSYNAYDRKIIEKAGFNVNAYFIDLPQFENDPIRTLKTYGDYYGTDMTHWSEKGHKYIQEKILLLLSNIEFDKSKTIVHDYDSTDFCTLWYESGQTYLNSSMTMNEFKPNKFALEATKHNDRTKGNIIELENPWDQDAHLFLSYMATAPDHMYPMGVASVKHRSDGNETAKLVMNTHVANVQHGSLHIVMHWKIGIVAPGKSDLVISVEDQGEPKPWNVVRLVGVILTPRTYGHGRVSANF